MSEGKPSTQLNEWSGTFGDAYTDRNVVDPGVRAPAFKTMLGGLGLKRILEVGCNRGHNLASIAKALGPECELAGVEPNPHALETARAGGTQAAFIKGDAYNLPFKDAWFDLAFTSGVLIHIPTESLTMALDEIHRVSAKYILCIEYFSESEEEVQYRGRTGLLWKRNFGGLYQERFPSLKMERSGYWTKEDGFDRTHWWLFRKP
jgi:pseudaminic acid biosynthesis-associated methylase